MNVISSSEHTPTSSTWGFGSKLLVTSAAVACIALTATFAYNFFSEKADDTPANAPLLSDNSEAFNSLYQCVCDCTKIVSHMYSFNKNLVYHDYMTWRHNDKIEAIVDSCLVNYCNGKEEYLGTLPKLSGNPLQNYMKESDPSFWPRTWATELVFSLILGIDSSLN